MVVIVCGRSPQQPKCHHFVDKAIAPMIPHLSTVTTCHGMACLQAMKSQGCNICNIQSARDFY